MLLLVCERCVPQRSERTQRELSQRGGAQVTLSLHPQLRLGPVNGRRTAGSIGVNGSCRSTEQVQHARLRPLPSWPAMSPLDASSAASAAAFSAAVGKRSSRIAFSNKVVRLRI
jgi:hypothetical protein